MTIAQRDLAAFLGKKNFKGLYTKNPLARTPAYAKFNPNKAFLNSYPLKAIHRSGRYYEWQKVFSDENARTTRVPFSQNELIKTNRRVGENLRQAIITDHNNGESVQRLSFKYGLVVPRIEALIRLDTVRKETQKNPSPLAKDVAKMAKVMKNLFAEIPTDRDGKPLQKVDDLTEIPIPKQVSQQFFQSIAESEPFGPMDAAETLGIEPAKVTLDKLTQVDDENTETTTHQKSSHNAPKSKVSFYAQQLEGERHRFRFTEAKVGSVGFHYGASRDDRKHARRVRYLPDGRPSWSKPVNSS